MMKIHTRFSNSRNFQWLIPLFITTVVTLAIIYIMPSYISTTEIKKDDFKRIASEEYDSIFLSQYPLDTFQQENFSTYRGLNVIKMQKQLTKYSDLTEYIDYIFSQQPELSILYLGISPWKTSAAELLSITNNHPSTTFEILLECPSMQFWQELSGKKYSQTLADYHDFISGISTSSNCYVYDYTSDYWLIANPGNYQWLDSSHTKTVNETVAKMLFLNTFCDHNHRITSENYMDYYNRLQELTQQDRDLPPSYPDFSDKCIIFFGDSVIGNYTGSTSIPGVVAGLSKAVTYNLGIGGSCAASSSDNSLPALNDVVDAFLAGDISSLPANTPCTNNLIDYLETSSNPANMCFVINYGLNDYFVGNPVQNNNPLDEYTYAGAIRSAVHKLKTAYPDAEILLNCPNFSINFENGTLINSEQGGVLTDYVDTTVTLGEELSVYVLNNYELLGINAENYYRYLDDDTHPNNATRFTIGQMIIHSLSSH